MRDEHCVAFLQWVLPQLQLHWPGFRKMRRQVCKRLQRRIVVLKLSDIEAYRRYLQDHADEWPILDHLCRVTVSRFNRDKVVLEHVCNEVLPELAQQMIVSGETSLRVWSAGCAMGEEAYSIVLIWENALRKDFPQLDIHVLGTDIDEDLLQRAGHACYPYSSVKALPEAWLKSAFRQKQNEYCLEAQLRNKANFIKQDIRKKYNEGPFHVVFCRNMVFTYFTETLQLEMLEHIRSNLIDGGTLIIGGHESIPEGFDGFEQWSNQRAIFRKTRGSVNSGT
jgi:chemotaxis protein methyltransferase CheR